MNLYEWLTLLISALMLVMYGIDWVFVWRSRLSKPPEPPAEQSCHIKGRK